MDASFAQDPALWQASLQVVPGAQVHAVWSGTQAETYRDGERAGCLPFVRKLPLLRADEDVEPFHTPALFSKTCVHHCFS